ncbi:MAG TPA: hypothetical protein VFJ85_14975 [Acidimicrobiales bacterium]|nr:hypothetical protein [Acidimicrobiales bacterium]
MDDAAVIDGFLRQGAKRGFGPTLHIEGDALMLHGWWHTAYRVTDEVIAVRNEEPREEAPVLDDLIAALEAKGLLRVAIDPPLIQPITYTELSLGQVSWALWAPDPDTGQRALEAKAGEETFLSDNPFQEADWTAELGGARRVAGLPTALVLTVGVEQEQAEALGAALGDCRMEIRTFEEFPPSSCGALIPGAIVVDATGDRGREFIMELRTEACGRFIPVAALTDSAGPPPGADEVLHPAAPPAAWVPVVRSLLP